MHLICRLVVVPQWVTMVLLVLSSWALGGHGFGMRWIVGVTGWLTLLFVICVTVFSTRKPLPDQKSLSSEALPRIPWIGIGWLLVFTGYLVLSALNPMYALSRSDEGQGFLLPRGYWEGLPVSVYARQTWMRLVELSGILALCLALAWSIRTRWESRRLLRLIVVNSCLLALVGSLFKLMGSDSVLGLVEPVNAYFFASFLYHNHWVAYASLSLGCTLGLFWYHFRRRHQIHRRQYGHWLFALGAALLGLSLPLAGSRIGFLFLLLWVILVGITVVWQRDAAHWQKKLLQLTGVVTATGAIIGYIVWLSADPLADRWFQTNQAWERARAGEQWWHFDQRFYASPRDTLQMVVERPAFGWGLGAYEYIFYLYAGPEYRNAEGAIILRNEHAHNDWLQYWAELGTVGILWGMVGLGLFGCRLRANLDRPSTVRLWAILGCASVPLMAVIEFPLQNPAVLLLLPVLLTASIPPLSKA